MAIKKMQVLRLKPIIDRVHRDSEPLQFLRELVTNSEEAGATRIKVGVDHHTGKTRGIWRLVVWDDGRGMTGEQMQQYLNNFGSGGKSIGGAHENFGIGSKTSILPRNHAGMVVCSWTSDNPQGSMIKLKLDKEEDEYGMHVWPSGEVVTAPHDDGDVDWRALRQDWMKTGTMIVLLGNTGTESTYLGICGTQESPARQHSSMWWAVEYLGRRYWSFSPGVNVSAWSFDSHPTQNTSPDGANRRIRGAKEHAEELSVASGCVQLPDKTMVHWYLKDKSRVKDTPAAGFRQGAVAALYKREMYHIKTHHKSLKMFGLTGLTRSRTLIIFEPPALNNGFGVSPCAARRTLKMNYPSESMGSDLPWDKWAEWWRDLLPDALTQSMLEDQKSKQLELEPLWGEQIIKLFGDRWRKRIQILDPSGPLRPSHLPDDPDTPWVNPVNPPPPNPPRPIPPRPTPPHPYPPEPEHYQMELVDPGDTLRRSRRKSIPHGLPSVEWVDDAWTLANAVAASYTPASKAHPAGIVEMNWSHRLFVELFDHHCSLYPSNSHIQDAIKISIRQVYERHLVTNIAHTHHFKDLLDLTDLLDDASLTQSMFGLYAQHDEITKAITALCGPPKGRR